jgi:NRPS condensation-like uncharacterized protein
VEPAMSNRPLGIGEQLFARLSEKSSNNAILVVVLKGAIDRDRFRRAFEQASQLYPTVGARVAIKDKRECLEFRQGVKGELRIVDRDGPEHWRRIVEEELDRHIPATADQLSRAVLLVDDAGGELVMSSNHVITDGVSGENFTRQILSLYAGAAAPRPLPPFEALERLPRRREAWPKRVRNFLSHVRDYVEQSKRDIYRLPIAQSPQQGAHGVTRFLAESLDGDATKRLAAACRSKGATMHGAICAALLLALRDESKAASPIDIGLSSPVNLRPSLLGDYSEHLGYFAGTVDTVAKLGPDVDVWQLAHYVNQDMGDKISKGRPWFDLALRGMFLKKYKTYEEFASILREKSRSTVLVTNIGRLKGATSFGDLELAHRFHVPSCHFLARAYVVLAAATVGDVMRMTFCYSTPYTDEEMVQRIARGTLERLRTMAEAAPDAARSAV